MSGIRVSTYTISVGLGDSGDRLFVHGYTGEYCRVPAGLADIFRSGPEWFSERDLAEKGCPSSLVSSLKRAGFLTDLDLPGEEEFFSKIVSNMLTVKTGMDNLYAIIPSYECNFNCDYCFQKEMRDKRGEQYLKKRMDIADIHLVFDAIESIENNPDSGKSGDQRTLCLYGGEPFLPENAGIIECIVNESAVRGSFRITAISNGYALDHFERLLSPDKIGSVQVTLDGLYGEHTDRRHRTDSSGDTFIKIARNIDMALGKNIAINIRANIDSGNIDAFPALIEEIKTRKWDTYKNFSVSAAPVFDFSGARGNITCYNSGHLLEKLSCMKKKNPALEMVSLQDERYVRQVCSLFSGKGTLLSQMRYNYCSAPSNMYTFDPYGNVYSCMEIVGLPEAEIGTLRADTGLSFTRGKKEAWNARSVLASDLCRKCPYALFCGGGCANKAEYLNGSMYSAFCDGFKTIFDLNAAELYLTAGVENGTR